MTGRARARSRARGRARGQEASTVGATPVPAPGYSQITPQLPPAHQIEAGNGAQARIGQPKGAPLLKSEEFQISTGFQEMSLGERGGRRRDYHDLGVNTRYLMEHYHIDYNPQMEARRLRAALLFQHENLIGKTHAFDGSILFLPKKLENKVTEVLSQTRQGEAVKITITLTNELPSTSPTCLQFYNIIFRRLLKIMNLQQIGRNYYNPSDPISIPKHRLMIWPGFTTSILQYETSIMLCTDVSHKVLRSETVLDFMYTLYEQVEEERYNNKTYRVDDIDWESSPRSSFKKSDGTEISFVDYYKMVRSLTNKMRSDFNVMKDLSVHTRLAPEQRMREVGRLINYINKDDNVQKELRDWGLSFESKLLSFSGRVVQSEKIRQGGKAFDYNPHLADWSRETRGATLTSVKPLENWLLIYTRRNYDAANVLVQNLFKVTPAMGIRMSKAIIRGPNRGIPENLEAEDYLRYSDGMDSVVCLLSSNRKDKYDAIKKYLCTDCPTPSQCVLARTLSKPQTVMAIATKIALQMNCKMGGELWSVEIPLVFTLRASRSRARNCGWTQSVPPRKTALRTWYSYNEHMPTRIIVYRDGVGDGQLKTLVSYEIPQFLECLKTVGADYRPKLTVIVVKKRVNSRFFAEIDGKLQNPPPGTVIDLEVTRPEWYDFFIVSQSVKSGTVAPTHYNVIYDSSALKPDYMQRLTYKLCHMYYNWPGVIRVPAPCQYAHKLAFLVGQSIHREPNLALSEKLYYL
ncbi:hypothetical protein Chor_010659 [Crotalus horridus]